MPTKQEVAEVIAEVDALDLPDGAHWSMVHERLGLEYGDLFPIMAEDPEFFGLTPVKTKQENRPRTMTPEEFKHWNEHPRITPSEALYGFMGWLTALEEPVTLSAYHDASVAADLVSEWLSANGFTNDDVRPVYPSNLKKPDTRKFTEIDAEFVSRYD
jgi:hypothetical protein